MKIYHYTSIETLALILHNKTIRFSRLDYVDDPDEFNFKKYGYDPSKYVYVSCWTKSSLENIPQWIMYGNKKQGVRISVDSDLFQIVGNRWLDNEEIYSLDYMIMPKLKDDVLRDIEYVENVDDCLSRVFQSEDDNTRLLFPEVARYKNTIWSFQKESRFILCVFPKEPNSEKINPVQSISNNIYCNREYIDIPINERVLDTMEITLGPEVIPYQEIIVKSLINQYAPKCKLKKSRFSGVF